MAGDWIKMRTNLHDDPKIVTIAESLGIHELHAVGLLYRLWAWADSQSVDGNALSVTTSFLDRMVSAPGFADALRKVGWIEGREHSLSLPRFSEHNGQTAKQRALTAKRVASHKVKTANAEGNAAIVSDALPREEKRREENTPPPKVYPSPFLVAAAPQPQEPEMRFEELTAEKPKAPRQRDECFEALAEIEGGHCGLTVTARGAVNKALKEIRQASPGVLPDEIRRRVRMYRMHFRDATVSACALAKHWARCERMPEGVDPLKTAQGNPTHLSDLMKRVEAVCNAK